MRYTFRTCDRIRKTKEFDRLIGGALKVARPGLAIHGRKSETGESRLGVIISRKVKGSVRRNRLKRIARETFRLNRSLLPNGGSDIVLIFYNDLAGNASQELRRAVLEGIEEFGRAFARMGANGAGRS